MKRLVALFALLAAALAITLALPGRAESVSAQQFAFARYIVPPGHHQLEFRTGARPPISALVLLAGGSPNLKISQVVGTQGLPNLVFNPPATPFEFTIQSIQRPLFNVPSVDFVFSVQNDGTRDHVLNLGAIYR